MFRRIVSILLAGFVISIGAKVYALEPAIRSVLNKQETGIGEKINLTVELEWRQDENSAIVVTRITPPSSSLLEQIDSKQRTSSRLTKDGAFAKIVLEYVYTGKKEGEGGIEPAVIEYAFSNDPGNKKIIKAPMVNVKIISRKAMFGKKALTGMFGVLAAVLFSIAFVLIKKRAVSSGLNKIDEAGIKSECLEKKLCETLKGLNKHRVSGNSGDYYDGLEKALFDYVKKKHNTDLTSGNMDMLPEGLKKICGECVSMAERVRFSGYKPQDSEQDRLIRSIDKYMKSLIPGENEEDTIKTVD